MRTATASLALVLCAALASGAPNLGALLGGGHHHHHHGGPGNHGGRAGATFDVDFGEGIELFLRKVLPGEHYNPFLPSYRPPARLATVKQPGRKPQPPQQQTGFIDASLEPQQQGPGFIDASQPDPLDLNVNPGSGSSGPKGPLISSCASGLVCVPESMCDPYTGFVVGTLDRPAADPRQPTVALQRCQGGAGAGVCCRDTVGVFQPGPGQPAPSPAPVPVQPPFPGSPSPDTKTGGGGGGGGFNPFAGNPFLGGFGGVFGGGGGGIGGGGGGGNSGGNEGDRNSGGGGDGNSGGGGGGNSGGNGGGNGGDGNSGGNEGEGNSGGGGVFGSLGELVACDQGQRCVDNALCGADGYVMTGGSGTMDVRPPTGTFCFTPVGDTGTCCRDRAGSGPTRHQSEVQCTGRQSCVEPPQCDEEGFIITDGSGLLNARNHFLTTFCRLSFGGKGRCCEPRPSPSTSREVTCQASQECVQPDLCDENGRIITDGGGLINARFNTREYCLLSGGGKGRCCQPDSPPQPPTRQQVFCDADAEDCVAPGLCGEDGVIITDGSGIINPRFNVRTYCLSGSGQEGTCCRLPPPPVTSERPSTSREVTCQASQECVQPDLCDENGRIITDGGGLINARFNTREFCRLSGGGKGRCCQPPGTVPPPPPLTCGQSLEIRILGVSPDSTEASFGELPWQAIISYSNYTFVCGGSLVSPQHVVTAAHCVGSLQADDIQVRLGEYQVNAEDEPLPHQDRKIAAIAVHPSYQRGPLFYDLAVLRLSSPVELDSHIQPICLPSAGQRFTGRCVASGWGKNAFRSGRFSTILKKVRLPMVGHGQCEANLRNTRLGRFFQLNKSFVCAGGEEGIDACKGDGGGPLACPVDGRYTLAGVTSWGIGCGTRDVPGVYASTEAGLDFLRQQVGA